MKKLTLLILLVFLSSCLNAQINLDSLYNVWEDKTQTDSIRVKALDDYIWFGYVYSKPDSAIVLSDTLFEFSRKLGIKKVMAAALNMKGLAYYVKGDYSNALDQHQKSLFIRTEMDDKKGIASSNNNIGLSYNNQGKYLFALDYFKRALKIQEELDDKGGISNTLGNIGVIYKNQGNFQQALIYQERALKINEEIAYKKGIANTLGNIGIIYMEQGNYSQALEFYHRALKIQEEIGNKQGIANSLGNIGIIYYGQGNYLQALKSLEGTLKIQEEMGDKNGVAESLNNIGLAYIKQGKYREAIGLCQRSLKLSKEIGATDTQMNACSGLYKAYKGLGKSNQALLYHEQMLTLNDSLQTKETAKKLQQMEFSKLVLADSLVQVEKDLKVKLAHQTEVQKKDKNRNIALGGGMFFLFLSGGLYSRWRYVKKSKAVIEKEKDRSENLLLNILPSEIAEELKEKGSADARDFEMASILFTDFKGFTQASEKLTAKELIEEINSCFKAFDHICETYGIEKIKTIGDAYMAAGGLPVPSEGSIKNTVLAALEMQSFISNRIIEKDKLNKMSFKMRLGIHTGPVVAGIVGVKKFQYDIWGDTVNTASRMESSGEIGKVNISQGTYAFLKDDPDFTFISRGKINAKGKGEMEMYFVEKKLK